jgi:hypothetical protein
MTIPAVIPEPSRAAPATARTITETDNGATIPVNVGATIALSLRAPSGSDPWQVRPPDPQILAPIAPPGATVASGVTVQTYRAVGAGQTAITAESRPHCDPGKACAQIIQGFRVTVIVTV